MKKQLQIITVLCLTMAATGFGQLIVKNNSGTEVMRVDNGGNTSIAGNLGITNISPTIQFNDPQNSTTDPATMWLHFNENQFYLLDDTDQDGAWGPGPWPFQYNGTAKMATFGRGNVAIGARDESSNNGAILSLASTGGQQAYHLDVANDRFRIHTDSQEKIALNRQGDLWVANTATIQNTPPAPDSDTILSKDENGTVHDTGIPVDVLKFLTGINEFSNTVTFTEGTSGKTDWIYRTYNGSATIECPEVNGQETSAIQCGFSFENIALNYGSCNTIYPPYSRWYTGPFDAGSDGLFFSVTNNGTSCTISSARVVDTFCDEPHQNLRLNPLDVTVMVRCAL